MVPMCCGGVVPMCCGGVAGYSTHTFGPVM